MADNAIGSIWQSERGMLLVIAFIAYVVLNLAFAFRGAVPESSLILMGNLLLLGFGFYYKDKAAEATAKTDAAKVEAVAKVETEKMVATEKVEAMKVEAAKGGPAL